MIDNYLQSKTEMDDHAIHLLFSANRWEKAYDMSLPSSNLLSALAPITNTSIASG
jgi:thymidylate kinase